MLREYSGGLSKLRIDFDTSIGDMTYTTLKNTLPMAKQLFVELGESFVHFVHMHFCVYLFTLDEVLPYPSLLSQP